MQTLRLPTRRCLDQVRGMGFVVRVVADDSGSSQWIAPHTTIGVRRMGSRDEARVFLTEADADVEMEVFRLLTDGRFRFEIQFE